jgi:hypothetical protein
MKFKELQDYELFTIKKKLFKKIPQQEEKCYVFPTKKIVISDYYNAVDYDKPNSTTKFFIGDEQEIKLATDNDIKTIRICHAIYWKTHNFDSDLQKTILGILNNTQTDVLY